MVRVQSEATGRKRNDPIAIDRRERVRHHDKPITGLRCKSGDDTFDFARVVNRGWDCHQFG